MKQPELTVSPMGTREWRVNGTLHREDGPAVEYADGGTEWFLNGELHRTDGPAVEYADGSNYWYLNGKCHRKDGPAVVRVDGIKRWWLNGHRYDIFDKYVKAANWTDEQIVEWKLTNEYT
jgi:hypothetical protein